MAKTISGFSTRLKEAMSSKHLKQVELCEKTGIGKSSMSHYINGTHSPTTDRVYLLAKALGVNEAWLLGYDAPMDIEHIKPMTTVQANNNFITNQGNLNYVIKQVDKLNSQELEALKKYIDFALSVKKINEKEDLEMEF